MAARLIPVESNETGLPTWHVGNMIILETLKASCTNIVSNGDY